MIRFVNCPKCGAQIENLPGVPCWSCGYVDTKQLPKDRAPVPQHNTIDIESEYYSPVNPVNFTVCPACGAQCESSIPNCWACNALLPGHPPHPGYSAPKKTISPNKDVPFGDIVYEPPEPPLKHKDQAGAPDKLVGDEKSGLKKEDLEEEREKKKEGKLILFHCLRCNEYFKVIFRKVRESVKCPACKNVRMKVSYYCTRCKTTVDFDTIERHVCDGCKIDMILDPNFE